MTTITVTKTFAGNLAIESDTFVLPVAVAKTFLTFLKGTGYLTPGSYESSAWAYPIRRAIRAKAETVNLYAAGFSTGKLSNLLYEAVPGIQVKCAIDPATDQRHLFSGRH